MALTYERIQTVTGTGSSTVLSITSIPQTYTHLRIVCWLGGGFVPYLRVNNSSGNNYSISISGNTHNTNTIYNTSDGLYNLASFTAGSSSFPIPSNSDEKALFLLDLPFYSSTFAHQIYSKWFQNTWSLTANIQLLSALGAISSVQMIGSSAFSSGSTMSIYGFKAV